MYKKDLIIDEISCGYYRLLLINPNGEIFCEAKGITPEECNKNADLIINTLNKNILCQLEV